MFEVVCIRDSEINGLGAAAAGERGLCPRPRDLRRHDSGVRWVEGNGPLPKRSVKGPDAPIGAPSTWLSLDRLRPRRAGLRFTRQAYDLPTMRSLSTNPTTPDWKFASLAVRRIGGKPKSVT